MGWVKTMVGKLTYKQLHEVLDYDKLTGIFRWKKTVNNNSAHKGDVAGTKDKCGYVQIGIYGKRYYAHRLAWFYTEGYFPEKDIDHVDRVPYHNWRKNLREASAQCNRRNTGNPKNNTSSIKGVCFNKRANKWMSRIKVNQSVKHLGYYKDFSNAVCARLMGEQCENWEGCDSSSPAYQYVQKNIIKNKQHGRTNYARVYTKLFPRDDHRV